MDKTSHSSRRKNTKISFRTDEKTLTKLKAICRMENITISSLIENVLTEHVLRDDENIGLRNEKRLAPRKSCSLPAVLSSNSDEPRAYYNGTIVSISANSMQIVLNTAPEENMLQEDFVALFSLPTGPYPLLVTCTLIRIEYVHEQCLVAARFHLTSSTEEIILDNFLNPSKSPLKTRSNNTFAQ